MISKEVLHKKAHAYCEYLANDDGVYSTSHLFLIDICAGLSGAEKDTVFHKISKLLDKPKKAV